MNQKLLRLVKKLGKFTHDDLVIMMEEEPENLRNDLQFLVSSGQVKKTGNSYVYFEEEMKFQSKNKRNLPKIDALRVVFSKEELQKFSDDRKTSESYKNAPAFIQKKVDKYVLLIREVNGMTGVWLRERINKWNEEHPDMKTSYSRYVKNRALLRQLGIEGLIPAARNFSIQSSNISENLYSNFKEYLLNNTGKTLKQNYNRFKEKFFSENPEMEEWEFPSYFAVTIRIKKDVLHFKNEKLSEFYTPAKKVEFEYSKRFGFLDFKSAANDFLLYLQKERKLKTLKNHTTYINHHLIPFFDKYRLDEITPEIRKIIQTEICPQILNPNPLLILLQKIHLYMLNNLQFYSEVVRLKIYYLLYSLYQANLHDVQKYNKTKYAHR